MQLITVYLGAIIFKITKENLLGITFFTFLKQIQNKRLLQLNKTGGWQRLFKVTKPTVVCSKHFHPSNINRSPGRTRHSLKKGSRLLLHNWNNFRRSLTQARKLPALTSIINTTPAKKRKNFVDKNKENNYVKILTPDKMDFEIFPSKMK